MSKVLQLLIIFILVVVPFASAMSCEKWNELNFAPNSPQVYKALYITGFYEGFYTADSTSDKYTINLRYGVIADLIDGFCSDYKNINVIFTSALEITKMQIEGKSSEKIDAMTMKARMVGSMLNSIDKGK